jgi:hypothetical protein
MVGFHWDQSNTEYIASHRAAPEEVQQVFATAIGQIWRACLSLFSRCARYGGVFSERKGDDHAGKSRSRKGAEIRN